MVMVFGSKPDALLFLAASIGGFAFAPHVRARGLPESIARKEEDDRAAPARGAPFEPVPEGSRKTFWIDDAKSSAPVRRGFEEMGWTAVANREDAEVLYTFLPEGGLRSEMEPWQRHNHIPHTSQWNHKDSFHRRMKRYKRANRGQLWAIPKTYQLNGPRGRERFRRVLFEEGGISRSWVLKIPNLDRGQGITMLEAGSEKLEKVLDFVEADEDNKYIIQEYICNQMTIDNHNFNVRAYWLVASINPLVVLYHPGSLKISTLSVTEQSSGRLLWWNKPKKNKPGHMRQLEDNLNRHNRRTKAVQTRDAMGHVEGQIKHSLAQMADAFKDASFRGDGDSAAQNAFGLYCADFLVDANLDVHFLEPQRSCSMLHEPRALNDKLAGGMAAILEVVADLQERGEALENDALEHVGLGGSDYEVIYNGEYEGGWMFEYGGYERDEGKCAGDVKSPEE